LLFASARTTAALGIPWLNNFDPVPVKMPPQILRLVLLTVAIVGSYFVARAFLTPQTFGEYGWYRGAAMEEVASRTPVFAGKKACDECHSDVLQKLEKFEHKNLSCEACHGVSQLHVDNPNIPAGKETAGEESSEKVKLAGSHCTRCHEANPSRPKWFKQIVVKDHYSGKCIECHLPHQPSQTP
jgi:hypothetical protein